MTSPHEMLPAIALRLSPVHRRVLLCAGAVLLAGGGLLWRYATEDAPRAEARAQHPGGVVLTLAQNARGEVIATLHNRTRERKEFFTEPQRLEVLEADTWQLPPPVLVRCGLQEVHQAKLGPGESVAFPIRYDLDRVKPGQTFRVIVYSDGAFKSGLASESLVFTPRAAAGPRGS